MPMMVLTVLVGQVDNALNWVYRSEFRLIHIDSVCGELDFIPAYLFIDIAEVID